MSPSCLECECVHVHACERCQVHTCQLGLVGAGPCVHVCLSAWGASCISKCSLACLFIHGGKERCLYHTPGPRWCTCPVCWLLEMSGQCNAGLHGRTQTSHNMLRSTSPTCLTCNNLDPRNLEPSTHTCILMRASMHLNNSLHPCSTQHSHAACSGRAHAREEA
jgi:hypothetical protein